MSLIASKASCTDLNSPHILLKVTCNSISFHNTDNVYEQPTSSSRCMVRTAFLEIRF